jgi:pyridoxal 5'-phosphate synthase pdxT subunit
MTSDIESSRASGQGITVGVLALQGDFDAHRRRLLELGAQVVLVRKAEQLDEIDALIIPGGESTAFLKLLGDDFLTRLRNFVRLRPTLGTCAGAILLATDVQNPPQTCLGVLDITVMRNAYGRQLDSSIRTADTQLAGGPMEAVFIRAPKIARVGSAVEVLAHIGDSGEPVLVRQGNVMAATFHPELSPDPRVHQAFLNMVRKSSGAGDAQN